MGTKFDKIIGIVVLLCIIAIAVGVIYLAFFKKDKAITDADKDRYFDLKEREVAMLEKINGYLPTKEEKPAQEAEKTE